MPAQNVVLTKQKLLDNIPSRPEGYYEDVVSYALKETATGYVFTPEAYRFLVNKYNISQGDPDALKLRTNVYLNAGCGCNSCVVVKAELLAVPEKEREEKMRSILSGKTPTLREHLQKTNTVTDYGQSLPLVDLATNFATATAKWVKAGFPVSTQEEYDARAAICKGCEFWQEDGNRGFGKCAHKSCGCTKFKRWMATEKCPLKKW